MRKPTKNSIDYYMLPNKIVCSIFGMWPFDERLSTWKTVFSRFRLIFSVITICAICVPQIILVATNWGDMKILTEVGCFIITTVQLLFKIVYLIVRKEKTYRLYKELRSLWDTTDDPTEKESYEMFAYWARTCTIVYISSAASFVTIFLISTVYDCIKVENVNGSVDENRHFPFQIGYESKFMKSPKFEIIFAYQMVGSYVCAISVCCMVANYGMVILHISGQFRLISTWINNIGFEISCQPLDYFHCLPPNVVAGLIKCVRHHQRLISLIKEINNLLTPIVFIQLLMGSVEICLSGFTLLNNDLNGEMYKCMAYLTVMMMQFIMWCCPGEILIQESQELGYSVYLNIPWYKLPPIYRRYLVLIILRAQKYCSISTIMFETLSIHTLTVLCNSAASYVALLRQMQEKSLA